MSAAMVRRPQYPSGLTAAVPGRFGALAVTALAALAAISVATALSAQVAPIGAHLQPIRSVPGPAALERLPAAARVPVSRALGRDQAEFWAVRRDGALSVSNPVQGLAAGFSPAGVSVWVGSARVSLSLHAFGYGNRLAPVMAAPPMPARNRITFTHLGVAEWYVNGPLGLEQGFTIAAPRAGSANGRLTLALSVAGSLRARLGSGGAVEFLSSDGRSLLSYDDLRVTDATGHQLTAALSLRGRSLAIEVTTVGARYPLTIDPLIHAATLTGGGESGPGQFGWSVALSANGSTALVGGPQDDNDAGAVWVFTRSGAAWRQQGPKLPAGDETGAGQFGSSMALSADGSTALIGGPQDDSYAGAAWVFTRSGATWIQQGSKLTGAAAGSEGSFGLSVALSADGTTALVGAVEDNLSSGAIVFTRSAGGWSQQAVIATGSPGSGGSVDGFSTALSGDGDTALIGGNANNLAGAVWVFSRSGSTWSQQGGTLTGSGEAGPGQFGLSGIALSTNGDTALIGGANDNGGAGAAWVFTRSGSSWRQQRSKLTPTPGALGFGSSVALSGSGNTALIGAPDTLEGGTPAVGGAWVFIRSRSKWARDRSRLIGGSSEGLGFGASVALSSSGQVALIGATSEEVASTGIGSAWVFVTAPNSTITSTSVHRASRSARFTFKATGIATGFQCALVRRPPRSHGTPPFSRCRSPKAYRHLKPGRYTFLVRALDGSVADPTPATRTLEIG